MKQDLATKSTELQSIDLQQRRFSSLFNKDTQTEKNLDRASMVLTQQLHELNIQQQEMKNLLAQKELQLTESQKRQEQMRNSFEARISSSSQTLSGLE